MEESRTLTVFGATIQELAARRGIRTWTGLSAALAAEGYDYKPERISGWARGRHAVVDRRFGHALADTLELSEEERIDFALAWLWGQDQKIS